MKKMVLSLPALGLVVLSLAGVAPSFPSQIGQEKMEQAETERRITLDVACDGRTFRMNGGIPVPFGAVRGDTFIVNGKIYPADTLPTGTASNSPDDPGGIGTWICRGTFASSWAEIITGAEPHGYNTQFHLFDDGRGVVSDGPEGGVGIVRAVVGGMGLLAGASGEMSEVELGRNSTGAANLRFTITLKKQAPK